MRKTARKADARTLIFWLASPDKSSPFRWMGTVCAVYADFVERKAERGVERSRTRRGTKKRGNGSTLKTKLKRALARVARDESLMSIPRVMEKSAKAMERIDKRHNRGLKFALGISLRKKTVEDSLSSIRERIMDPTRKRSSKGGLRKARERLTVQLSSLRQKELKYFSALWGLPYDATEKRLSITSVPPTLALPRVHFSRWAAGNDDVAASLRRAISRHAAEVRVEIKSSPCSCRKCRTHILCPMGHGVSAGRRTCGYCDFVRHDKLSRGRPDVKRASGNGRSERDHPTL